MNHMTGTPFGTATLASEVVALRAENARLVAALETIGVGHGVRTDGRLWPGCALMGAECQKIALRALEDSQKGEKA